MITIPANFFVYVHTPFGEEQGAVDAIQTLTCLKEGLDCPVHAVYYPGMQCPEIIFKYDGRQNGILTDKQTLAMSSKTVYKLNTKNN